MSLLLRIEEVFEKKVLKQLPKRVKILYKHVDEEDEYLKEWIIKYNISTVVSKNLKFVTAVKYSYGLKCMSLIEVFELEKLDPLFNEKNQVHSLRIMCLNRDPNKMLFQKWYKNIVDKDLYPGEIDIRGPKDYSMFHKRYVSSPDWTKWMSLFNKLNGRKEKEEWKLKWKVNEIIRETEKEDAVDEQEYYCYLTTEQIMDKIIVNEEQLKPIIKHGEDNMKVIKSINVANEVRICSLLKRKLPLEFL